jgi:hypothetical protein
MCNLAVLLFSDDVRSNICFDRQYTGNTHTMKKLLFTLLLWSICIAANAQHLGISISGGVRKTWNFTDDLTFDLRQQIQVNPEIRKFDSEFGDFFNEEGFWPIPDQYRDDDDDDEEEEEEPPVQPPPPNELDDSPYTISFEWRTSSVTRLQYSIFDWMRVSTGYTLFYNGEEFRHAWQSELDYRPLLHSDKKRKFDLSTRVGFQRTGRPAKKGGMKWESFLTPRIQATFKMDKKHTLYGGGSLNGGWDDGIFEFDRYRLNGGIQFSFKKTQMFDLGYQYQVRLDKPGQSNSISLSYMVRL